MPIRGPGGGDDAPLSKPISSAKPLVIGAPTPKPTVPSMRRPTPPPGTRPISSVPPAVPAASKRPAIWFPRDTSSVDDESPPTVPGNSQRTSSIPPRHALGVDRVSGYTTPPPPPPVSRLSELADQLVGAMFAERYRVHKLIGRGSSSLVFAAEAAGAHLEPTPIALKILDPSLSDPTGALSRLHGEVRALQVLASDNVTRVYDVGLASAPTSPSIDAPPSPFLESLVPFVAMELLEGRDLRTVLLDRGPLDALEVVEILQQVALVLERAHGLGIVHRDLKPANLFLVEGAAAAGRVVVKVLDFGVASLVDTKPHDSIPAHVATTTSRGFFGTPWYMAPEQIAGGPVTPQIDVWALGLIAFRLLTKESYWPPKPIAELLAEIVAGPRHLPSDVVEMRRLAPRMRLGENFDAWFMRACEIAPADRFRTVAEQVTALAYALERDR